MDRLSDYGSFDGDSNSPRGTNLGNNSKPVQHMRLSIQKVRNIKTINK